MRRPSPWWCACSAALGGEVLIASLLGIALLSGAAGAAAILGDPARSGVRFAVGPLLLAGPFLGLLGAPLVRAALGTELSSGRPGGKAAPAAPPR